jgi:hypothetical protein
VAEIVTAAELTLGLQKGVLEDLDDGVSSGWSGDGFKQESAQYLAQADPKSSRLVKKVCFLSQLCAILDLQKIIVRAMFASTSELCG